VLRKQELEKLISYSGTPTAVWRRTGEICLVGLEFSMLTEWSQQDLQNKFIYEVSSRSRAGGWMDGWTAVSLQILTALRKTIRGRILGSLCAPFLRVTHSIRIFPLRASQALWGAGSVFILFHYTTGYF
jgi:hypothetical protein